MKIVAVICAYWESRQKNIERIISDLRSGTIPPDKIIVLNNNKDLNMKFDGAYVINSEVNSRTRGKYLIGLIEPADYYLMLDDDTSVSSRTIEALLKYATRESVLGYCGVSFEGGNGKRTYPSQVTELTPTQYFLGCGIFGSFYSIIRLAIVEEKLRIPFNWLHEGDDILMGLANDSFVPPLGDGEGFVDLDWGTEAMSWGSDGVTEGGSSYLKMRDRFTIDAMNVIKEHGIPKF